MSTTEPSVTPVSAGDPAAAAAVHGEASEHDASAPHPNWRWFWLSLIAAALPLLVPYFTDLWANATYRYFPFALAGVAWLTYQRSDGHFYGPRGWFSWSLIGLGLLLLLAGVVLQFPWFAAVAFALFTATMLHSMRGEHDRSLLVLALPLLTLIRPIRADVVLVLYLQSITTWMASVLLDALAVPHAVANNVIRLADRELFVAQACSGIQSVFTLAFLSLLVVAWKRRRVWMAPLYLLIACVLAVFANIVRVTVVAVAANSFQADLAQGWPHELLGYVALAMAFGFLLSFDHLIATLLHRVPDETDFNPLVAGWNRVALHPEDEYGGRATRRDSDERWERDRRSSAFEWSQRVINFRPAQIGFLVVAGLLCAGALFQVATSRKPVDIVFSDSALVFDPPGDLFQGSLATLSVVNHDANRNYEIPGLGANSDVWDCQWQDVSAKFVLSQPHQGWHELCDCYERLQWLLLDRKIKSPEELEDVQVTARNPDALSSTYVVARFKRGPAEHGYLLFAGIGSDGTLVEAPDSLTAFTHRVWNRIDSTGVWDQNEVIMLQMWVARPEKLSPEELQQLEKDFIAARARVADEIAENAGRELPPRSALHSPADADVQLADNQLADNQLADNASPQPPSQDQR